jgi:hypothetical protein
VPLRKKKKKSEKKKKKKKKKKKRRKKKKKKKKIAHAPVFLLYKNNKKLKQIATPSPGELP